MSHDIEFAVRMMVDNKGCIDQWRKSQFQRLVNVIDDCKNLDDAIDTLRSSNSKRVSGHIGLASHAILGESICWPDTTLAAMLTFGAKPLGIQPNFGIFQERFHSASGTMEEVFQYSVNLVKSLKFRKPPLHDQRTAIFEKTLDEQSLGLVSKFYEEEELNALFGPGRWCAIIRFALWQEDKWRMIDNGKQGANWTYEAHETIFTSAAPQAAAAISAIRRYADTRLRGKYKLCASSRDMKAAYKQIPMDANHASMTVIIVYDIIQERWRFVISHALLFGLSGAVLQFNRIPTFIVALARRWLGIVCHAFFDDFRIIDFACEKDSAVKWFDNLTQLLGWKFDANKNQTGFDTLPMLGNLERYADIGYSDSLMVEAKPERLKDFEDQIDTIIANATCTSGTAASIRGRALHLALTRPGKTGRLPIPAIDALAEGKDAGWSEDLLSDLSFLREQPAEVHIRKYPLMAAIEVGPRVWSDASFSVDAHGIPHMRVCCIIANGSTAKGVVYDTSVRFFSMLASRKSQIGIGELMGVLVFSQTLSVTISVSDT